MIAEFITHLQGAGLSASVEYAFTSEPLDNYSDDLPAILVYPSGSSAQRSGVDNLVVQDVTEEITCMLGCAISELEARRAALRAAAIGWVDSGSNDDAMELTSGDVIGVRGGVIWWTETYTAAARIYQS